MPLRRRLMPYVAAAIVSPGVREVRSSVRDMLRRVARRPHVIRFFYCAWDPLSHLTAQALVPLMKCEGVSVVVQSIHQLPQALVPRREGLIRAALNDAPWIAEHFGLAFPTAEGMPGGARLAEASLRAAKWELEQPSPERWLELGRQLWGGEAWEIFDTKESSRWEQRLRHNEAEFLRLGGHRPGSVLYAGQWYAGIERLHYLMSDLARAGVQGVRSLGILEESRAKPKAPAGEDSTLELFFSVRSPYSYLAFDRTVQLAERHGIALVLKPVLPMVMRGLPVPRGKAIALLTDAAREAEARGIAFGRVCDPVGAGVERCYAVSQCARELGREAAYFSSCTRGCWAEGIDLATDRGLAFATERAGIPWSQASAYLEREAWREDVQANLMELEATGLWGVPSFRFGERTTWGQDRLGIVDSWLRQR